MRPRKPSTDGAALWTRPPASASAARRAALALADAAVAVHGEVLAGRMREASCDPGAALGLSRDALRLGLDEDGARDWLWLAGCLGSVPAAGEMATLMSALAASGPGSREGRLSLSKAWTQVRDRLAFPRGGAPADPIEAAEAVEALLAPGRGRAWAAPSPWEPPPPGAVGRDLLARWPWAFAAAGRVEGALAMVRLSGALRPPNLLFLGPAGTGKAGMARWLAGRLGLDAQAAVLERIDATFPTTGLETLLRGGGPYVATAGSLRPLPRDAVAAFEVVPVAPPGPGDAAAVHANALDAYRRGRGLARDDLPRLADSRLAELMAAFAGGPGSVRAYEESLALALDRACAARPLEGAASPRPWGKTLH